MSRFKDKGCDCCYNNIEIRKKWFGNFIKGICIFGVFVICILYVMWCLVKKYFMWDLLSK